MRAIADKQQVNVNKLVELVKENEIILAKMRVRCCFKINKQPIVLGRNKF